MSEILAVFKVRRSAVAPPRAYWLILDCGHWYKWDNPNPLKVGAEFDCPDCKPMPTVVPIPGPNVPPSQGGGGRP